MNRPEKIPANSRYSETVLVLQGGGALGAYQAGVYETMHSTAIEPDWVSGISIDAINAAIIAGNPQDQRIAKLRSFWETVTSDWPPTMMVADNAISRSWASSLSAWQAMTFGIPGFFAPFHLPAPLALPGSPQAISWYDTSTLRDTLLAHADFDRINSGGMRLSLGAVNVTTGNFAYFDNRHIEIRPEHVMASGALPPGFPPVEIDGEYFWDGGLVSNTPLSYVLDNADAASTLVLQVDLFSARGNFPSTMDGVEERRKDIIYSSRTRMNTDRFLELHKLRRAVSSLASKLPEDALADPQIAELAELGNDRVVSILHLIYRRSGRDGPAKDYEFSRRSMHEHWRAGSADARRTLRASDWHEPPAVEDAIAVYDLTRSGVL